MSLVALSLLIGITVGRLQTAGTIVWGALAFALTLSGATIYAGMFSVNLLIATILAVVAFNAGLLLAVFGSALTMHPQDGHKA